MRLLKMIFSSKTIRWFLWALAPAVLVALPPSAFAASGVWTNIAGGSWAGSVNWSNGIIASGAGSTADFSTRILNLAPTVTLDSAPTIGNLTFGDQGNAYGWTLASGAGGPLTLSGSSGQPVVTVNNQMAAITGVLAGAGGLVKAGPGTLVLLGTNTYTGTTSITNGTLTYSGAGAYVGGSSAVLTVGGATGKGVFNLASSGTVSFTSGTPNIGGTDGATDSGAGAVYVSSGTLNLAASPNYVTLGDQAPTTTISGMGGGTGYAYGYFNQSGGTVAITSAGGTRIGGGGVGVWYQSGGVLTCPRYFAIGGNGTQGGNGLFTMVGGAVTVGSAGYYTLLGQKPGAIGILNLGTEAGGTGSFTAGNSSGVDFLTDAGAANGTLNLNSGTLILNGPIQRSSGNTTLTDTAIVNCNGGTVQAAAALSSLFTTNSGMSIKFYKGGLAVDSQGYGVTNVARLAAAPGNGFYPAGGTLAIASGGAGYIGAPWVNVTNDVGAHGSNVMAIATISGGAVNSVVITSPGENYVAGDILNFVFINGGATTPAATYQCAIQSGDLTPNNGALVKLGSGALTLSAPNSYSGGTVVSAGTLSVTSDGGLGAGNVAVTNGATLTLSGGVANNYIASSATLVLSAGAVVNLNFTGTNYISSLSLNGGGTFLSPGVYGAPGSGAPNTNAIFTGTGMLNSLPVSTLSVGLVSSANPSVARQSVTFTGTVAGSVGMPTGTLTFLDAANVLGTVTLNGAGVATFATSTLAAGSHSITAAYSGNASYPTFTSAVLTQIVNPGSEVWSGASSGTWDIGITTNWTEFSAPTTYLDGDNVQFDDSATGTTAILLGTTFSPHGILFNNRTNMYSLGGSGTIAGTGALVKLGAGAVTLSTANSFTGVTMISNGIVNYVGNGASAGGGALYLGTNANTAAVLNLAGSGVENFFSTADVGGAGTASIGGAGAINQTAGTVNWMNTSGYLELGYGGYGAYVLAGGTMNFASASGTRIGDNTGGLGNFLQTGGTCNLNRYFVVGGNNGTAPSGVATLTGGILNGAAGYYLILGNAGTATGTLNLGTEAGGNATLLIQNSGGISLNNQGSATGILNLNSGAVQFAAGGISKWASGSGVLNLNGGTLAAMASGLTLVSNTLTSVNVYDGGVTVDSQDYTNTISASLLNTSGNGIYPAGGLFTIASGGGSGYIGAPLVTVSGGSGSGAMAIATIAMGTVSNVVLTCPGQNYLAGDVLNFSFAGGGAATPASTFSYRLQAGDLLTNGAGGLTEIGWGVMTLNGALDYSGPTTINGGTLYINSALNPASAVSVGANGTLGGTGSAGNVTVESGGSIEGGQGGAGALTLASLNYLADGAIYLTPGTNIVPLLVTNDGGFITGNEADSIAINLNGAALPAGTYHLIAYSGLIKGVGFDAFTLGSTPAGGYSLLNDSGYVDLEVSPYPLIITEPASVSVANEGSVSFSVTASDPGTLTYQWFLNGTNLMGATNATLVLSFVTAADQGTYTVRVSDGTDTAISSGATLTIAYPSVSGQWDFKSGDLRATVGSDLQFVGDTANLTTFTNLPINGVGTPVMAFGACATNEGFYLLDGALPNGPVGSQFVNQYTLIMDIMFPASSSGQLRALFQTDPFNHPGSDAEYYVGNSSSTPDPNGLGVSGGQFNGTLTANTWYRIAFGVDLAAGLVATYVNGVQVGSQSVSGGVDGQYAVGPAAQLFTTGLGGGVFTQPGYVSSIQFVNAAMSAGAIASLGCPNAGKLPPGNALLQCALSNAPLPSMKLGWSGPAGIFQVQGATNLANPNWQTIASSLTNYSLSLANHGPLGFYRVSETIPDLQVGQLPYDNEEVVPTKQILQSAGQQVQFSGRPVDMVLSPDGSTAYIKDETTLVVVDVASWTVLQTLGYPSSGASLHGIATSPSGSDVYVTSAANQIFDWSVGAGRTLTYSNAITLTSGTSEPCGLAISADGSTAYVCLNLLNSLAVVNLSGGTVSKTINVGIAPWDVKLSPDGAAAYVSDWGGRVPTNGDMTASSDGTSVVVDSRGIASSGEVSFVNLTSGVQSAVVATGLHPTCLALSADGSTLYVANANSDTVSVINTQNHTVKETILVRPYANLPFGTQPSGLALSASGANLLVACAENNGIAVVALANAQQTNSIIAGFIPTDWYPGAVLADNSYIYAVNVKGLGARYGQPQSDWQIFLPLGTANKIPIPSAAALSKYTAQVFQNGRVPQILQAQQPAQAGVAPAPVPAHVGEPSVFQHVLYVIKENKTYDEMFGDLSQANSMSSLCIYPQSVSPNHHALASQFALLDNYYCNGVNSADGHCWCDEGNCADQFEKSFGGFNRSYAMGTDPLVYSSSGFIWNNVLSHGLTFRNFGEFFYSLSAPYSWLQYYRDYTNGNHALRGWPMTCEVTNLTTYTSTNVPGSNLNIPDVVRAYGFIQELNAAQTTGVWPAFSILYLCDDHTGGAPSAQAQVADNDLALGQVVQAVSNSRFWTNTVIFVIEDDPQSGYDHVDGHRSLCLVISPYTVRSQVVSTFYNQCGVVHTMEQILGIPPMNQQDAMAPLMFDCFTNLPNFAPYVALPNTVNLATGVSGTASLSPKARYYARLVRKMGVIVPDRIDDNVFNRYIWHSIKGDARYPAEYVGAHGKGLKQLGLTLAKPVKGDDD